VKDFFRFVGRNFYEARVLFIKYLVAGGLLFILTIIANRLELRALTYFNAMFLLSGTVAIIGFGAANAASIYINQNQTDKREVESNFKLGLWVTLVLAVLLTVFIIIFKEAIFKYFIVFDVYDNYLFFYLMIPTIFFTMLMNYFYFILRRLKSFWFQIFLVVVHYVPLILGVLIISLVFGASLVAIAVVSNIALGVLVPLYLFWVFRFRLEVFRTNIFNIFKVKVNNLKTKLKTMTGIISIEGLWSIGYTLTFLFVLKKSEALYNSISYFNSFFNLTNGLFFALLTVASIRICRKMGQSRFDECYREGKFIIYQTVLMWVVMAGILLAISPLLFMGMNVDIRETGRQVLWLLLIMLLFNYVDWALSTYIIPLGGKTRFILILTVICLVYKIFIFLFANQITNNIYLIVALITADSAFNIVMTWWYFAKKKWLVNVNDSMA